MIILILCLAFSASSFAAEKTEKTEKKNSIAVGKAEAMKYMKKRKPAQEQPLTTVEDMQKELDALYDMLMSDVPSQDKYMTIQHERQRLGNGLTYLIRKSSSPNDPQLQKAYNIDNAMIFLSELKLDTEGQWTQASCNMAVSVAQVNADTGAETRTPVPSDDKAIAVLRALCGK
jgi:hypothetical protein